MENADRIITLDEWVNIRKYIETKAPGSSSVYRDYFFHREGAKGGTGLRGVTIYEAVKVGAVIMESIAKKLA